jgi:hypothetical protein
MLFESMALIVVTAANSGCPALERYRIQHFHFEGDNVGLLYGRLLDGTGWTVEVGEDAWEKIRMVNVEGTVASVLERLSAELGKNGFTIIRDDDRCQIYVNRAMRPARVRRSTEATTEATRTQTSDSWVQGGSQGFVPVESPSAGQPPSGWQAASPTTGPAQPDAQALSASAPAPAPAPAWESRIYHAEVGKTLSENVRKWVESEGWRLVWEYPVDHAVEFPFSVRVIVRDGAAEIMEDMAKELFRIYNRRGGLQGAQAVVAKGNQTLVIK